MGYRSDVAIVIKTADNNKFVKSINDWDKKHNLDGYNSAKYLLKNADKDRESKDGEYRIIESAVKPRPLGMGSVNVLYVMKIFAQNLS